jgi:hypothetical protein
MRFIDFEGIMRAFGFTVAVSATRGSDTVTVWAMFSDTTPAVRHFVDRSRY